MYNNNKVSNDETSQKCAHTTHIARTNNNNNNNKLLFIIKIKIGKLNIEHILILYSNTGLYNSLKKKKSHTQYPRSFPSFITTTKKLHLKIYSQVCRSIPFHKLN